MEARLVAMARQGRAVLGAPHDPDLYTRQARLLAEGAYGELLDAERGAR